MKTQIQLEILIKNKLKQKKVKPFDQSLKHFGINVKLVPVYSKS